MTSLPFRVAIVAIVIPFALAVVGVALMLAWLPDLPATITMHWAIDGTADGFGPSWSMPVLLAVIGLALPGVFGVLLARTVGPAGPTATQKLLAAVSLSAVGLLSFVLTFSVALQRGLPAASPAPVLPTLGVGLLGAVMLGIAAWFAMPRAVSGASASEPAAHVVPVAPGEVVAWVGRARFSTTILVVLAAVVVLLCGAVVFAIAVAGIWPLAIVPVVVAFAVLGTASWRVRIDAAGFTARAALGWPLFRIPLADVASAAVTQVVPLGEFGGYGIRWGLGRRLGIVTRGGEALEVRRRDGRAVVVTMDDAATAAGLLTALAAR